MPVHLGPQRSEFVRKITEPGNEELCPEHIYPKQHQAGNHDAKTLDLDRAEIGAKVENTGHHRPHDQHSRTAGHHAAHGEIHWEHAAVIVPHEHHAEIPGDERVGKHRGNNDHRRQQIHIGLQAPRVPALSELKQPTIKRLPPGRPRRCTVSGDVGHEPDDEIDRSQHIKHELRDQVTDQQKIRIQPGAQMLTRFRGKPPE